MRHALKLEHREDIPVAADTALKLGYPDEETYWGKRIEHSPNPPDKALLKGSEARLIGYGDRAIIAVSKAPRLERRRVSAGHELGQQDARPCQSSFYSLLLLGKGFLGRME